MSQEQEEESTLADAYAESKRTGQPPICPYCDHPVLKVRQMQYEEIEWRWSPTTVDGVVQAGFSKSDSASDPGKGSADKPCHDCETKLSNGENCGCDVGDWDFVDEDLVGY